MNTIMTRKVPVWTLAVAILVAVIAFAFVWLQTNEVQYLRNSIRSREALVPGFLEHTSPLSDEALCRRNPITRIKDRLIGSDSCASGFEN